MEVIAMPMLLLLLGLSLITEHPVQPGITRDWTEYRLIAHGMGGIDGHAITNAYEAFASNYDKGLRVFEVDLQLTADGQLAALHDWGNFMNWVGRAESRAASLAPKASADPLLLGTFKSLRLFDRYRPMDIHDLAMLMEKYPDMYLITDTKSRSLPDAERQFARIAEAFGDRKRDTRQRLIPQFYTPEMYTLLEEKFPCPGYIFTLYGSNLTDGEVLRFVRHAPRVRAVTMPASRVTVPFVSALKRLGVVVYAHTVNDPSEYGKFRKMGVDGIYTDFLHPAALAGDPASE
jgi:glycerophosphoryl diester phosphodiesterase